ncbi:uridine cytidine kinase I, putative, partial [Ixodes scapularis]
CEVAPTTFSSSSGTSIDESSELDLEPESVSPRRHRRERTYSASASKADPLFHTRQRTIYTAGRPPWYDAHGQSVEPFVIGICGGSASGKTTVARRIIEALNVPWVTLLSMDSFYKVLNEEEHKLAHNNQYNFDHPDAFDFKLLAETLKKLKEGKRVEVPIYNFVTHSREKHLKFMYGANVIIFEGILSFSNADAEVDPHLPVPCPSQMMDMKVFIDTDSDIRLARRLKRDITDRGRDLEGCLQQYERFVKPAFDHYIAPTMVHADLIVPRGTQTIFIAINLIVQHVHTQLVSRGVKLRSKLAESHGGQPLPNTLELLPQTPQLRGIHTFIRNRETQRDEFIFYSKRLMRLLMEHTLSLLPFSEVVVETPQVRVPPLRSPELRFLAPPRLSRRSRDVKPTRAGKCCQSTETPQKALLFNYHLADARCHVILISREIDDYRILLLDATVATGAASIMAVRVLLDHDVPEENIMLCSLLMAESGVHSVAYAFPKVRIVTTAVDPVINEKFYIKPGIGNFGDRYFGTEAFEYS